MPTTTTTTTSQKRDGLSKFGPEQFWASWKKEPQADELLRRHAVPDEFSAEFFRLLETARREYLGYSELVGTLTSEDATLAREYSLKLRDGVGSLLDRWTAMKRRCPESSELVNWTYSKGTRSGDEVGRTLGKLFSLFTEVWVVTQPERANSIDGWRAVGLLKNFWIGTLARPTATTFEAASGELASQYLDEQTYDAGFPLPLNPFLAFLFDCMRFMDWKAADPRKLRSLIQEWPKEGKARKESNVD